MSRPNSGRRLTRLFAIGAILPLLAGAPGKGVAQSQSPDTREVVRQRIEALLPKWEEAGRRADRAERTREDSIRAENLAPQDTVTVGPITIVTSAGQGELAKELFEGPVAELVPLIRGHEDILDKHLWIFSYSWRWKHIYADAPFVHDVTMSRRYSRGRVTTRIRHTLGEALLNAVPAELQEVQDLASPRSILSGHDWSDVYRQLATAPASAAKECLAGDLSWCWEATGVLDPSGGEEWSTPTRRRALVSSRYERLLWTERDRLEIRGSLLRGCLVLNEDRACELILEGRHRSSGRRFRDYSVPLDPPARGTLVGEALRLGGVGSFGRLIAPSEASVEERLAAASSRISSSWPRS